MILSGMGSRNLAEDRMNAEGEPEHDAPLSENSQLSWFAIRVRPNSERVSTDLLERKGYEVFLPTYQARRQWSDRIKIIDRPLFPGYLFCRFRVSDWLPVARTQGVVYIVGSGSVPVPVEEQEMASLRTMVASGLPLTPVAFLHAGQKVRIERGPLTGVEGVLTEFKKRYRVTVCISILQRSVAAEIDVEWVRPCR